MISRLKAQFPVLYLCQKFEVSRSAFYEWTSRGPSPTQSRHDLITGHVITAFATSNGVAGYRKVTAALGRHGCQVDRKTVAGIMNA